jgi:hypothetical protein
LVFHGYLLKIYWAALRPGVGAVERPQEKYLRKILTIFKRSIDQVYKKI